MGFRANSKLKNSGSGLSGIGFEKHPTLNQGVQIVSLVESSVSILGMTIMLKPVSPITTPGPTGNCITCFKLVRIAVVYHKAQRSLVRSSRLPC